MKKLLFTVLTALSAMSAQAQFNYVFSKHTSAPYVPLTAGTSVNGNIVWDDENFKMPIGFNFDMDGITTDSIGIYYMGPICTDTLGTVNAFVANMIDLTDRNYDTGTTVSLSPVRYQLTGTAPNRIFKLEIFNAGFYDEWDIYNTMNDSVNYQFWLYETSNIVEIRFGDAYINHADDYFSNDSNVLNTGYLKQISLLGFTVDNFYFVKGDTSAPTIDSTMDIQNDINEGLNAWPSYGTVYRFEPPTLSVKNAMAALKNVTVYPTQAQQEVFVENGSKEAINYTIISMNGAAVNVSGRLANGKNTIDVSKLASGNYVLQLSSDKIAKGVKFTKL